MKLNFYFTFFFMPQLVKFEYFPITSTLTKIRVSGNKPMTVTPQREIICYPIMNVSKPIDLFAPFPRQTQTFVPSAPPQPPHRVSSKQSSTLKVLVDSNSKTVATSNIVPEIVSSVHRGRLPTSSRSRSAGSLTTSFSSLKEEKNFANHSRIARQYLHRVSSLSPIGRKIERRKDNVSPIAFGRSISKERAFAEEKKKMEKLLPLCRKSWTASTNILRNPYLTSPNDVKAAVQSTYKSPASRENYSALHSTRKLQSGGTIKTSTVTHTSNKLLKNSVRQDEKSVQMTVKTEPTHRHGFKTSTPVVVKANLHKSSRSTETKYIPKTKQITKTSSNVSLARTSSTFSIDSTNSKKNSKKSQTIKSNVYVTAPVTIISKSRKKKNDEKIQNEKPKSALIELKQHAEIINFGPKKVAKSSASVKNEIVSAVNDQSSRSEKFFQQLFLRDSASSDSEAKSMSQNTIVQQKAHYFDTIPKRSNRSSSARRPQSFFLSQRASVTGSKFKRLESENLREPRSLTPHQQNESTQRNYYDHLSKFNSFYQLSDEEQEFGCSSVDYVREERSLSEPRSITLIPIEKKRGERQFTPTREIRSPSSRRIQSVRSQKRNSTSTTSSTPRRYHSLDSRARAHSRMRSVDIDNESENILEALDLRRRHSEKFRDLNRFYTVVERVGDLERATSSTDLRPIRSESELIDYDAWKEVRYLERAERERNCLVDKLKQDERDKDFLYRSKYPEDTKWNEKFDRGLRFKEKSVEDLKTILIEKSAGGDLRGTARQHSDNIKTFRRGNSVADLTSTLSLKSFGRDSSSERNLCGISRNLISTLSKDQVNKIKSQLREIYSSNGRTIGSQECIIDVTEEHTVRPSSLFVRSTSLIGDKELLQPVLLKKQQQRIENNSFSAVQDVNGRHSRISRSADRYDSIMKRQAIEYSEEEKRKLLQQLGREIREKVEQRSGIVPPRETRGAIAVGKSILSNSTKNSETSNNSIVDIDRSKPFSYIGSQKIEQKFASHDSISSSEVSKQTVIVKQKQPPPPPPPPENKIHDKIHYFETKKDEVPEKIIYHAREDSSPDEEEVVRLVEERVRARRRAISSSQNNIYNGRSASVSDIKEMYGESEINRNLIEFRTPSPDSEDAGSKNLSNATSVESIFRTRSISPIRDSKRSSLRPSIANKYGTIVYRAPTVHSIIVPPRRFRSDPNIARSSRIIIKNHEAGDVAWITQKFESKNDERSRPTSRRLSSPILKVAFKSNRFMPHIDIISKTAALKQEMNRKKSTHLQNAVHVSGEVERIRSKFEYNESSEHPISLAGQMYTSSPDIREIKDISGYLTGAWVAHQFPKPNDNARSPSTPEKDPPSNEIKRKTEKRSNILSSMQSSDVKAFLRPLYDIFTDSDYDPTKHRPIARYVPDKRIEAEYLWQRLKKTNGYATLPRINAKRCLKFKGAITIQKMVFLYCTNKK